MGLTVTLMDVFGYIYRTQEEWICELDRLVGLTQLEILMNIEWT